MNTVEFSEKTVTVIANLQALIMVKFILENDIGQPVDDTGVLIIVEDALSAMFVLMMDLRALYHALQGPDDTGVTA